MIFLRNILILTLAFLSLSACEENQSDTSKDGFDRTSVVQGWVTNHIVPAYTNYLAALENLHLSHKEFQNKPEASSLSALQSSFIEAYLRWQNTSIFEIGPAEQENLRNFTNLYPCNTNLILQHIETGSYNLDLPSTFTAQGLPAIDFLLFDAGQKDDLIKLLSTTEYDKYLSDLIARSIDLTRKVSESWSTDYQNEFISDPTSFDRLVNDYLFYYEKFLRAGKVGIPAGVFSGNVLSGNVEALYSNRYSRDLLLKALNVVYDFYNGNSLDSYMKHVGKEEISQEIQDLWRLAKEKIEDLDSSLSYQVETDNAKMLEVYDLLQEVVILLKVDMFQALNIQVDYVDADGD